MQSVTSVVTELMQLRNSKGTDVSEDEIKDMEDDLQKLTDKYVKEVDKAVESKSKEVMTV